MMRKTRRVRVNSGWLWPSVGPALLAMTLGCGDGEKYVPDNAGSTGVGITDLGTDKAWANPGDDVTLSFSTADLELSLSGGADGHVHVYWDEAIDDKRLVMTDQTTVTVAVPAAATPGKHRLIVRLHDDAHQPVEPEVGAWVEIEVRGAGDGQPRIEATVNPWGAPGSDVTLLVKAWDFKLALDGSADGHLHVYWNSTDNKPMIMADTENVTVTVPAKATPGPHKFIVTLVDNDHAPLSPPVQQELGFTVSGEPQLPTGPAISATLSKTSVTPGEDVTISVAVENFDLDLNGERDGYVRVLWNSKDAKPMATGDTSEITVSISDKASAGDHRFYVELVDNTGKRLDPEAGAWVPVTVAGKKKPDQGGYGGY